MGGVELLTDTLVGAEGDQVGVVLRSAAVGAIFGHHMHDQTHSRVVGQVRSGAVKA